MSLSRRIVFLSLFVGLSWGFAIEDACADNTETVVELSQEEEINAVHFPLSKWDLTLLQMIEDGPLLLSRDEELVVEPYPTNNSEETKDELELISNIIKSERSKDNIDRILFENSGVRVFEIFLNEGLIPAENYKTLELLNLVDTDFSYFVLSFKKHFSRPRPSQLAPLVIGEELDLAIRNPGHAAYPSGHSGQTYIVALILAELDPDNADVYKQFSVDVAHRREIAGVHYPSDSEAGRQLARDVFAVFKKMPIFNKKFETARQTYIKPSTEVINSVKAYKRDYE